MGMAETSEGAIARGAGRFFGRAARFGQVRGLVAATLAAALLAAGAAQVEVWCLARAL